MDISFVTQNWPWIIGLAVFAAASIILIRRWLRRWKIRRELKHLELVELSEIGMGHIPAPEEKRLLAIKEMMERNMKMKMHKG